VKECGSWCAGRVERIFSGPVVGVAHYEVLGENEPYRGELVPVYRASKELATRKIAMVVKKNFSHLLSSLRRPVAAGPCRATGYGSIQEAYRAVHAPDAPGIGARARAPRFRSFSHWRRARNCGARARERSRRAGLRGFSGLVATYRGDAALCVTGAQRRVIQEIWNDLRRDVPMNRLLQGDVGSGKTLVAAAAF